MVWFDENEENKKWQVLVSVSGKEIVKTETNYCSWKLSENEWEKIKNIAKQQEIKIEVKGFKNKEYGESVIIQISEDKVEAPIFFRAVPLPFKFARENLKEIRWNLGSVAETSKPHAVLDNIPVCANCHSFTPDGKYIYFTKTLAKHYSESGIHNGSVPRNEDYNIYEVFEKKYMDRDSLMKFNIYRIPFNNGKGGEAEPVKGASNNGFSNYYPKISPDGKWLVFCQAESFKLLQKDSKLNIVPVEGGEARQMTCNTSNMNSWHSWSPNGMWLVFSTKEFSPYTQLFLTHINPDGTDTPPVYLENFSFDKYAVNIPEFLNIKYDKELRINPVFDIRAVELESGLIFLFNHSTFKVLVIE